MFDDADKFLKIAVGLGVLAAGAGVGYHFGVYIPQIEREKIERMEQAQKEKQDRFLKQQERVLKQQEARKERYDACNADAFANYNLNWANACKISGINNKGANCNLPRYDADNQDQRLADDKKRCLDEFKSGI